jgi:hypothetical protein
MEKYGALRHQKPTAFEQLKSLIRFKTSPGQFRIEK